MATSAGKEVGALNQEKQRLGQERDAVVAKLGPKVAEVEEVDHDAAAEDVRRKQNKVERRLQELKYNRHAVKTPLRGVGSLSIYVT